MYDQMKGEINRVKASELTIMAQNNVSSTKLTYDQYMNAGYEATNKKDYEQALNNFQEAVKLRPDNLYANTAIRNVKIYMYDSYMEQGYKANNERDYKTALNYFQKAVTQRPDDFYAQQATRNAQKFAQAQINTKSSSNNILSFGQNLPSSLFFIVIIFMAIISVGLAVIIVRLWQLKSSDKKINNVPKIVPETPVNTSQNLRLESRESKSQNKQLNIEQTKPINIEQTKPKSSDSEESNLVSLEETSAISNRDSVEELLSNLQVADSKQRRKIIWDLAQKGDSRAVKPLVQIMINADSYERSLILEALSQINTSTIKPMNQALLISLQDDNPQVRKNAIRDLTKVYDLMNQIHPLINHTAQNDSDEEVREIAKWALKKFSFQDSNPQLKSTNEEVNATLITDDSE